jgi:hypothetical protein
MLRSLEREARGRGAGEADQIPDCNMGSILVVGCDSDALGLL